MAIGIEGDVDTGVPHLVSNVCRRFTIGDQLAGEEMPEIVKSCARHPGAPTIGRQMLASKSSGWTNPWQSPGNTNAESALPTLRSARSFMTLSVAAIPRSDLRVFGGPRYHSHL